MEFEFEGTSLEEELLPTSPYYKKDGWDFPTIEQRIERIQQNIQLLDAHAKKVEVWKSQEKFAQGAKENNERVIGSLKLPITGKSIKLTGNASVVGASQNNKEGMHETIFSHETIYVNFKSRSVICRIRGNIGDVVKYTSSTERLVD